MYFHLPKETQETIALSNEINTERQNIIDLETGLVKNERLQRHCLGLYSPRYNNKISERITEGNFSMNALFGDYFEEYTQERVHHIIRETADGKIVPEIAIKLVEIAKKLHNKDRCSECEGENSLRIPSSETIHNHYHLRQSGRANQIRERGWKS